MQFIIKEEIIFKFTLSNAGYFIVELTHCKRSTLTIYVISLKHDVLYLVERGG